MLHCVADAYVAVSDAMVDSQAEAIIEKARASKLPTMFYQQDLITKGGLVSYSTDFVEIGRISANTSNGSLPGVILLICRSSVSIGSCSSST